MSDEGKKMDKVYFSKIFNPTFSKEDSGYMTLLLIPRRWRSISDWKFAMSFRAEALKRIAEWMVMMKARTK